MMEYVIWILISFICGSIPFSTWLGQVFLGKDIRQYGDGNPGATNVFKAGSPFLGVIVLLLDITKAALPVGLSYSYFNLSGSGMFFVATAPLLGHMYSPFLGFRGGKALATTLGVWIGLTIWQASLPAVLGVVLGIMIFTSTGWAVMFGMLMILITLLIWLPDPLYIYIWIGQTILLAWTHQSDITRYPRLHQRVIKLFKGSSE
jgi:glycerol-3-phosphate acyltransferase PlsY